MSDKNTAGRHVQVIAHRGASGLAPENTLPAFELAQKMAADAIELDVRLTMDGKVAVCHNATVDAVTSGRGSLITYESSELGFLDAGYHFTLDAGASFPYRGKGVKIPLLEEVLQRLPDMKLIVELKESSDELVLNTAAVLSKYGRLQNGSALITSFNHQALTKLRRLRPDARSGCSKYENIRLVAAAYLKASWLARTPGTAFQLPVSKFGLPVTTPRVVSLAHRLGLKVQTYTVNDESEMRRLIRMGVDALFTDHPHRLRWVINQEL